MKLLRTIIFIGAVILGIVLIVIGSSKTKPSPDMNESGLPETFETKEITSITESDRIRGSKDAPIIIVEYSDLDCPFCHQAHPMLKELLNEQPQTVAWVYRHLPIESLHPEAFEKALLTECIGDLKGDGAFWKSIDSYMEKKSTSAVMLESGVSLAELESCMTGTEAANRITASIDSANDMGIRGTPYFVVIGPKGQQYAIPGMPQGELLDLVIEQMLSASEIIQE
jgi:protein-disulfide isomerase